MDEKETSEEISFFRCDTVRTGHVVVGPGAAYAVRPWWAGFADESGAAGTVPGTWDNYYNPQYNSPSMPTPQTAVGVDNP